MTDSWKDGDSVGGRYRLMRVLRSDGSSVLWEAHDDEAMELVHLRILRDSLRREPLVVLRFCREVDIGERLDHGPSYPGSSHSY